MQVLRPPESYVAVFAARSLFQLLTAHGCVGSPDDNAPAIMIVRESPKAKGRFGL